MARTGNTAHFQARRRLLLVAGALAALAACGGSASSTTVHVKDRQIAVAPGVSLHVRDWSAAPGSGGDADVIVLQAGLGANAHAFDSLAPALARRHRVLAITRRGYGQSGKPLPIGAATYAPATLVADLLAVLDALQIGRLILAGHSIAGNELTLFAGSHPRRVRGLVYLDTTFDYLACGGYEEPEATPFDEPPPGPADLASLAASIAYAKRIDKQWWPALEANWRDALDLLPDGSVRPTTPPAIARAMDMATHDFFARLPPRTRAGTGRHRRSRHLAQPVSMAVAVRSCPAGRGASDAGVCPPAAPGRRRPPGRRLARQPPPGDTQRFPQRFLHRIREHGGRCH